MQLHAHIYGRVQGVFFRQSTKEIAIRLGITGWVANRRDGRVEILAQGSRPVLEEFLKWLHRGPSYAHVDRVESELSENIEEKHHEFKIRY